MLDIGEIEVRPVSAPEERLFQDLMLRHHYLGALPKIGETIWYVAAWREQWVALSSFFAAALKCAARDSWVGWDFRLKYQRLKLVTNNSRFPHPQRTLSVRLSWDDGKLVSIGIADLEQKRRGRGVRRA